MGIRIHSDKWFEKLTSMGGDGLTDLEHQAIIDHILVVPPCEICARFMNENDRLDTLLQNLPAPDFPKGLSPRLQQLMRGDDLSDEPETNIRSLDNDKLHRKVT